MFGEVLELFLTRDQLVGKTSSDAGKFENISKRAASDYERRARSLHEITQLILSSLLSRRE